MPDDPSPDDPPIDDPGYEVGYGRPPRHTRFRKGRSGNPKGRPQGARNIAALIDEALDRRIFVKEHGKRRSVTKGEAMVTQLVNRSAAADLKAIALLLRVVQQIEARDSAAETPQVLTAADENVMKALAQRLRAAAEAPAREESPEEPPKESNAATS